MYAWGRSQIFEFLALELLGKSVIHLVYSSPGLTLHNVVALACQMVRDIAADPLCLLIIYFAMDAIQHVHSHGIIHCDIKPRNFLLGLDGRKGHVKLIDFGLARNFRNRHSTTHSR